MLYLQSNFPTLDLEFDPFEFRFRRKSSICHLRPFGCKCFILKCGNLDKFKSRSSHGILLGYTPHGRSYRVFNLEINTIVELCDVPFDETAPYPHDAFECAGDKKMEEGIFVDEELHGFDDDEDELVPASTLEVEAPQATTSSTAAVDA
jgi:hypothetical protein